MSTNQNGDIQISPDYRQELSDKMGVDPADIDDTFQNPDQFENTEFKGLALTFVLREFPQFPRPYYVLGYGERKGKGMNITMIWKIHPWDDLNIHDFSPLQLLRRFATDFGLNIQIGNEVKRFYFHETLHVTATEPRNVIQILNPDKHEYVQQIFTRHEQENDGITIDCALGLCIDMFEYRTAINPQ
jgi:hypothetical protein